MKKFKFTIHGNEYDVEIGEIDGNVARIQVNGTQYEVILEKDLSNQKTPQLVRGIDTVANVEPAKSRSTSSDVLNIKESHIKAPMPGVIIEVHVKVGDKVVPGQKLITIEAMKMENMLHADRAGTVKQIKCSKGDSVKEGDILMIIGE